MNDEPDTALMGKASSQAIAARDKIRSAIVAAKTPIENLDARDAAERSAVYAELMGLHEMAVEIHNLKLEAEYRLTNEFLGEGKRGQSGHGVDVPLGHNQRAKLRKAYLGLPRSAFEDLKQEGVSNGEPISVMAITKENARIKAERKAEEAEAERKEEEERKKRERELEDAEREEAKAESERRAAVHRRKMLWTQKKEQEAREALKDAEQREADAKKALEDAKKEGKKEAIKEAEEREDAARKAREDAKKEEEKKVLEALKAAHKAGRDEVLQELKEAAEAEQEATEEEVARTEVQVGDRSKVVLVDNMDPDRGIPGLADESVALMFTSPPYWNFKDYAGGGLGCEESYDDYIQSLTAVINACVGKVIPGGYIIMNVSNMKSRQSVEAEPFVYPIVADVTAIAMGAGVTFFDEMIWHKTDVNSTEGLGGRPLFGSYPYPPTPKMLDSVFENILVFRKSGVRRGPTKDDKLLSEVSQEDWQQWTNGLWKIPPARNAGHPAAFPPALAERIIRLYSFHGDTVLDPFAGTGTTIKVADQFGRVGIGYEIAEDYEPIIREGR